MELRIKALKRLELRLAVVLNLQPRHENRNW